RPQDDALVGGQKRPYPDDVDAVHALALEQSVTKARIKPSFRMVRRAGDNLDLMPHLDPQLGMLVSTARQRTGLRRKIMRQEQDFHDEVAAAVPCRVEKAPRRD